MFDILPLENRCYPTRVTGEIKQIFARTDFFKHSFFPYCIREWNRLDSVLRSASSLNVFKSSLLKYIRPSPYSIFGTFHPIGIKYLTRLRLGLSHLREHKFKHNFQDSINPLCSCGTELESTEHFLLRCQIFALSRKRLFESLSNIDPSITGLSKTRLSRILLYGDSSLFNFVQNSQIINSSITFLIDSERFDGDLFLL